MSKKDKEKMKRRREDFMRMVVVYGPPERLRKPFERKKDSKPYPDNYADIHEEFDEKDNEDPSGTFNFCPMCGKDLRELKDPEATISICDHCGKRIPMVSSYCPYCGKPVREVCRT